MSQFARRDFLAGAATFAAASAGLVANNEAAEGGSRADRGIRRRRPDWKTGPGSVLFRFQFPDYGREPS